MGATAEEDETHCMYYLPKDQTPYGMEINQGLKEISVPS